MEIIYFVLGAGIEPTLLSELDFKSSAATITPPEQFWKLSYNR